jgi:ABC-type polysaccharide/polyol phosphate transport system ATPase subunit
VILGVPREELERRLPSIIEFAELEEFIDTPVKHYSSAWLRGLVLLWRCTFAPTFC